MKAQGRNLSLSKDSNSRNTPHLYTQIHKLRSKESSISKIQPNELQNKRQKFQKKRKQRKQVEQEFFDKFDAKLSLDEIEKDWIHHL